MNNKKTTLSTTKNRKKRVFLLFDADRDHRRGILRGIANYCKLCGDWDVFLKNPSQISDILKSIATWNPDGLIYTNPPARDLEKLSLLNIPIIIEPAPDKKFEKLYYIDSDTFLAGTIAAEYYLEKGFNSFAYCGYKNLTWSKERCLAYCNLLEKKGFNVSVYEENYSQTLHLEEKEQMRMINWLAGLTRPVAIFACNDMHACNVIAACRAAKLKIPDEVAVLGVDNDEIECNFLPPPLSSIAVNTERAGYEAAELLQKLISGQKVDTDCILVKPKFVIERQSTDILHVQDKDVANALTYIRQNSNKILQVSDIVKFVTVSRRSLERKFNRILGYTIHDEISKYHMKYIIELLIETDMPILNIAKSLGYTSEYNMSRFFHKSSGYSPKEYRRKFGLR